MDGESLSGLVAACLRTQLSRHGAVLPPGRFEQAHRDLLLVALQLAERYDPTRSGPNYTFASYLWDVVARRLIDWWRRELGDSRHPAERAEAQRAVKLPLSFNELADRDAPITEDDPFGDMDAAVDELAASLSAEAAWTLENLVRPMAEGAGIGIAAREAGVGSKVANIRLEELREELSAMQESRHSPV